jgi:hypothetical protein
MGWRLQKSLVMGAVGWGLWQVRPPDIFPSQGNPGVHVRKLHAVSYLAVVNVAVLTTRSQREGRSFTNGLFQPPQLRDPSTMETSV